MMDGFMGHPASGYANFFPHLADQPPPPPMHPGSEATGGLNVADPRYAAKYGNPYLQHYGTANQYYPGGGRPAYATLSGGRPGAPVRGTGPSGTANNTYSPSGAHKVKKQVNYAGTMLGNGSMGRANKMPPASGAASNGTGSPPGAATASANGGGSQTQYIVSPDREAKVSGAMATHV